MLWRSSNGSRSPESVVGEAGDLVLDQWDRLPSDLRQLARATGIDWAGRLFARLPGTPPPADAVAALLADLEHEITPGLAVELLGWNDRTVAGRAEGMLLARVLPSVSVSIADLPARLAEAASDGVGSGCDDLAAPVLEALVGALDRQAEHERSGPALVSLALLDQPSRDPAASSGARRLDAIRGILDDPDHPAFAVIRRLLRRDRSPMTRRLALRLLTHETLGMPALERLALDAGAREHEAVLEQAHLVLHPGRADKLALLPHARGTPAADGRGLTGQIPPDLARLDVAARRGLARFCAVLPSAGPDVGPLHHAALTEADDLARLMHARHAVGPALVDFCFDRSPAVARTAVLCWSAAGAVGHDAAISPHRARLGAKLSRSPHRAVRRLMRDEPGVARHPIASPRGRLAVLTELGTDPDVVGRRLLDRLGGTDDADERVAIVSLARRLGALDAWRGALPGLLCGTGSAAAARVAATLASALRDLGGPYPGGLVGGALDHPDPRVRANAVESVDRLLARGRAPDSARGILVEFKSSDEHRVRANAVRGDARCGGRLMLGTAGEDLEQMLTDERPMHRLAGVWLAERVLCGPDADRTEPAWQRAAGAVAGIAKSEIDPHVRARGVRCARRLLSAVASVPARPPRRDPAEAETRAALERFAANTATGRGAHA